VVSSLNCKVIEEFSVVKISSLENIESKTLRSLSSKSSFIATASPLISETIPILFSSAFKENVTINKINTLIKKLK
jgi:hypothetical protein